MDGAAITTVLTVAGTLFGSLWGKAKVALKAEEAIADQPMLREEFGAHNAEDQAHHSAILTALARMKGSIKVVDPELLEAQISR